MSEKSREFTRAFQGVKNVSFLGKFGVLCFLVTLFVTLFLMSINWWATFRSPTQVVAKISNGGNASKKTKGRISKQALQEKQSTSSFLKKEHFLSPGTYTRVCVSRDKNCLFFRKFGVLCFLVTPYYSAQSALSNLCFLTRYRACYVKQYFSTGFISGNPPRSCDGFCHYIRSPKIERQQISNLIISIDSPFKRDHFL